MTHFDDEQPYAARYSTAALPPRLIVPYRNQSSITDAHGAAVDMSLSWRPLHEIYIDALQHRTFQCTPGPRNIEYTHLQCMHTDLTAMLPEIPPPNLACASTRPQMKNTGALAKISRWWVHITDVNPTQSNPTQPNTTQHNPTQPWWHMLRCC